MIGFTAPSGNSYKGYTLPTISLTTTYYNGNTASVAYIPLTGIKHISFGYSKPGYGSLLIDLYDKNEGDTSLVSDYTRNAYSGSVSRDLDGTYKYIRIYVMINGESTATSVISSIIASA